LLTLEFRAATQFPGELGAVATGRQNGATSSGLAPALFCSKAHSAAIGLKMPVVRGPGPFALDFFASAAQLVLRPHLPRRMRLMNAVTSAGVAKAIDAPFERPANGFSSRSK
jgi:hypothetical protein